MGRQPGAGAQSLVRCKLVDTTETAVAAMLEKLKELRKVPCLHCAAVAVYSYALLR